MSGMMIPSLYHDNCLNIMATMPSESVDLIVTDPPYLMDYQSGRRKEKFDKIHGDKEGRELIRESFAYMAKVLKPNSATYIFCSWHNIDFFKQEFQKHFTLKNLLVWVKNNHGSGDLEASYAPMHELILYGTKGRRPLQGDRLPDVVRSKRVDGASLVHPTEKPVDLCRLFIEKSSKPGDIVLDPFMGSGTTGVAAMSCGRGFIGIEIDDNFFQTAKSRLSAVQPVLF